MNIYIASKVKHAHLWSSAKFAGCHVASRWLDFNSKPNFLAEICVADMKVSNLLYIYTEPGEVHKGVLVELGLAIAMKIPVFISGPCDGFNDTFLEHSLVKRYATHDEAAIAINDHRLIYERV